jgi:hypothetical protein
MPPFCFLPIDLVIAVEIRAFSCCIPIASVCCPDFSCCLLVSLDRGISLSSVKLHYVIPQLRTRAMTADGSLVGNPLIPDPGRERDDRRHQAQPPVHPRNDVALFDLRNGERLQARLPDVGG